MRIVESKMPRECPNCRQSMALSIKPTDVKVGGLQIPSKCSVGICGECGKIAFIPKLAEIYIQDFLKKKREVLKNKQFSLDGIIEEANRNLVPGRENKKI